MFHFIADVDRQSHMQYLLQDLFGFFSLFLTIHFTGQLQEMPESMPERYYIKIKYT